MGIGDAYVGLVDLLGKNGKHAPKKEKTLLTVDIDNCTDPDNGVECLIGFAAETNIESIKRPTDDTIAHWYYAVSPPPLPISPHGD
jgi:histone deacetylase 6